MFNVGSADIWIIFIYYIYNIAKEVRDYFVLSATNLLKLILYNEYCTGYK